MDVFKEEKDTIIKNNLDEKLIRKQISIVGNKWIKTSADAQNDVITFAHTLSPVSAQANQKFGLEQNETITLLDQDNTFERL